jgi:DNA mismatch endonuclease, patch repair protein
LQQQLAEQTETTLPQQFDNTSEARRRIMRAIAGKGNETTEQALARLLRSSSLTGWRRHMPLAGRPDFAWRKEKGAVFVDGCFWHGCPKHYRAPRKNVEFWKGKIDRNKARDRRVSRELRLMGWKVVRIWECRVLQRRSIQRICSALGARVDDR